jgi:hypothetical protein
MGQYETKGTMRGADALYVVAIQDCVSVRAIIPRLLSRREFIDGSYIRDHDENTG